MRQELTLDRCKKRTLRWAVQRGPGPHRPEDRHRIRSWRPGICTGPDCVPHRDADAGAEVLDIDTHMGRQLFRRRVFLRLTQRQVAIVVGVRAQQIQKYECGANRISAAKLWFLAQALDVPMEYFFEGFAEQEPRKRIADVSG